MPEVIRRATAFVSRTYFCKPDAVKLGRIVLNPRDPLETYCDLFPTPALLQETGEVHVTPGVELECTYNVHNKTSLRGALLRLFSTCFSAKAKREVNVEGETKRYQLGNAQNLFKKACGGDDVRSWLQENVIKPKMDAYMIVGYHTITNPRIVTSDETWKNVDGDVSVNNVAMLHAGLSSVANIGAATSKQNGYQKKIRAVGEAIWAVQYRKVVYKLMAWSRGGEMTLKEGQWKMMWPVRGQDKSGDHLVETDLDHAEPEPSDWHDEDVDEKAPESYSDDSREGAEKFILFYDGAEEIGEDMLLGSEGWDELMRGNNNFASEWTEVGQTVFPDQGVVVAKDCLRNLASDVAVTGVGLGQKRKRSLDLGTGEEDIPEIKRAKSCTFMLI